jgi:hypothetical protein
MAKQAAGPPDLKTIGGRLRLARENAGYSSSRGAAVANGWNENTYKSHEQGERQKDGLKTEYVEKYARAFRVNPYWLMTGNGPTTRDEVEQTWQSMSPEERTKALRLLRASQ